MKLIIVIIIEISFIVEKLSIFIPEVFPRLKRIIILSFKMGLQVHEPR